MIKLSSTNSAAYGELLDKFSKQFAELYDVLSWCAQQLTPGKQIILPSTSFLQSATRSLEIITQEFKDTKKETVKLEEEKCLN